MLTRRNAKQQKWQYVAGMPIRVSHRATSESYVRAWCFPSLRGQIYSH